MTKEVAYNAYSQQFLADLSKGAFLTTQYEGKTNTMTIGWASIGLIWGKPVFTAMIRHSRYTHELIEKSGEFTISIPFGEMKAALGLCGSKSGRDMDKLAAANLSAAPGKKINTPVISGCKLHYECKVIAKQDLPAETLSAAVNDQWYKDGDYHTLYFGEILTSYIEE